MSLLRQVATRISSCHRGTVFERRTTNTLIPYVIGAQLRPFILLKKVCNRFQKSIESVGDRYIMDSIEKERSVDNF